MRKLTRAGMAMAGELPLRLSKPCQTIPRRTSASLALAAPRLTLPIHAASSPAVPCLVHVDKNENLN